MKVADGLTVSLFASEPMVQNPTSFDIDSKGRVWITEAANYRKFSNPPIRPEGDRIMVLEDSLEGGEAAKATVFYQDPSINAALGIAVLGSDVIVSAAPNVFLLRDTDGDGKADNRFLLLTGITGEQHDHAIHSFAHSSDGTVLFNFGNVYKEMREPNESLRELPLHGVVSTEDIKKQSSAVLDIYGQPIASNRMPFQQGMVVRADYKDGRLSHFEVLGNNFRNNYEAASDSFGNVWQSDNDDDGNRGVRINYVMENGNYGYVDELTGAAWQTKRPNIEKEIPLRHWHQNDPGVVPNLLQTGAGSPTGILFNEGSGLGAKFQNQIIHCDAGPRVVRAYPVKKSGAGFTAEIVDILTSTDSWFRPADVAIHPDGSLFVADWYDANVGGHGMSDNSEPFLRGRIYRIAAKGTKPSVPYWDSQTVEGAIKALESPNKATQYQAYNILKGMGDRVLTHLQQFTANASPTLKGRLLAILASDPKTALASIASALQDTDPDIVIAGIRLAARHTASLSLDPAASEKVKSMLAVLTEHKDVQVRRQLALSLYKGKNIAATWARLAAQHDGVDRWYLEALGIGATGADEQCLKAWIKELGGNWNTVSGRDILWRLRTPKTAPYLVKLLKAEPDQMRYMRAFDFLPDSDERTEALLDLARSNPSLAILTESIKRLCNTRFKDTPAVKEALAQALQSNKGQPSYVDLITAAGVGDRSGDLLETAIGIRTAPEALDAINLVMRTSDGPAKISKALRSASTAEAEALVGLLGSLGSTAAVDILSAEISSGSATDRRALAISSLAKTQAGATRLIAMAKAGHCPDELRGTAGLALAMVQYPSLKDDISTLFPVPGALGGKALPAIAELVKLKGDPENGKHIFERPSSSCVVCHRIGDTGVDFGPGLSAIGAKLPKEAIFEAIINPNAGISMGFETSELKFRKGGEIVGIVRSMTEDDIVLSLPGGAMQRIPKADIKSTKTLPTSLMPSGLNQALSQQDLVDLVEYLSAQRAVK